jgi:putative nucleotidyltransferase with HDIG domain
VALANVHLVREMEDLSEGAMTALARSVDAKSSWTAGHSERVTTVALAIARQLGVSEAELKLLHRGGLLHDIGKIGIPSALLNKPGPLTHEERRIVESHVTVGERILEPIRAFGDILPLVRSHHERFDGSGYPDGLAGTEIHRLARVMAVADVFDALSSDRPYRSAFSTTRTVAVIRDGRGVHYDPEIVDAFLEVMSFELVDRVPEQEAPEELRFHVPSRSA